MSRYHPDSRFLTDYAAGSLPHSQALCVAAHLHYCPRCRATVGEIAHVGTALFAQLDASAAPASDFDALMARIEALPPEEKAAGPDGTVDEEGSFFATITRLPPALEKITGGRLDALDWRAIGKHFSYCLLELGDAQRETSLLNIRAGGSVPHHKHRGDEITVVLKGSFSDEDDHYEAGDFIVRTRGEAHRPVASQDQDCLCLSTLDAPISPSNWLFRLLMPIVRKNARAL